MTGDTDRLTERLTDYGYAALLGGTADQRLLASVTSEPDIAPRLQRIVNDRSAAWQARFMASELLFRHVDMRLHGQSDRASLQDAYFQALRHNYTGNGADWGFGQGPDDVGVLGRMVIGWGGRLEPFGLGLDDDHVVTMSLPWGTPPHFQPPYRVKDFAALLVAKTRGVPVDLAGTPGQRDRAIAGLKRRLRGGA